MIGKIHKNVDLNKFILIFGQNFYLYTRDGTKYVWEKLCNVLKLIYLTKTRKRTAKERDKAYKLDKLFQGDGYPGLN